MRYLFADRILALVNGAGPTFRCLGMIRHGRLKKQLSAHQIQVAARNIGCFEGLSNDVLISIELGTVKIAIAYIKSILPRNETMICHGSVSKHLDDGQRIAKRWSCSITGARGNKANFVSSEPDCWMGGAIIQCDRACHCGYLKCAFPPCLL